MEKLKVYKGLFLASSGLSLTLTGCFGRGSFGLSLGDFLGRGGLLGAPATLEAGIKGGRVH